MEANLKDMMVMRDGMEDLAKTIEDNIAAMDRRMCNEFMAACMNMRASTDAIEQLCQRRLATMGK